MANKNVVIFGCNDTAALAKFYLLNDTNYKISAFTVDSNYLSQSTFENLPLVDFENLEKNYPPKYFDLFIPIHNNYLREQKFKQGLEKGYNFITYLSSKATSWGKIGRNCFILENNIIQPFVTIDDNCILWSGNHIGHHSNIKESTFLSSHIVISGHCTIESYVWIGVNTCLRDNITIKEGCFIGMGSVVTKSTKPYMMYFGNPAREIKTCGKN